MTVWYIYRAGDLLACELHWPRNMLVVLMAIGVEQVVRVCNVEQLLLGSLLQLLAVMGWGSVGSYC